MSRLNCSECQQLIAEDAKECPHCGHVIKQDIEQDLPSRHYGLGTLIYFIILIAGVFMLIEGRLTGLLLLIVGLLLIIGRYKLWRKVGKKIK